MVSLANHLVVLTELAAEAEGSGPNPWVVGGLVLAILLAILLAVITIGGGREHS